MAEPPFWAGGLPAAALSEIVRRVPCVIDRGSMAGVCRSWRVALAELPPPPPQLPWLILPSAGSTRAYCVLSGYVHHYDIAAFPHGARCFGSHEGAWLFLAFDQVTDHELVNLRSDRTLLIPDRFRLPEDDPQADGHDMVVLVAALSSPPDDENCVGACITTRWPAVPALRRFAFWHVEFGGDAYDLMPDPTPPDLEVEDVLCHNGIFHFLTQGEHIRVCAPVPNAYGDLEVLSEVHFFQPEGRNYEDPVHARYLVVSRGELLMVVRFNRPTTAFRVFLAQEDDDEEVGYPWSWVELDSLDGRMLFVGRSSSRSYEVAQYPGFEDGIYFSDDRCFYDEEMMFQHMLYPCSDNGRWSEGPPPRVDRLGQGPSNFSHPVWLLH